MPTSGRLVILTGPSCAGKTPLDRALGRLYPELRDELHRLVLYNDRHPRPGEVEGVNYHFRPRAEIEALRGHERFAVLDVRGDLQALDLDDLSATLDRGEAFFEGNPFVAALLVSHLRLARVPKLSCFLSPLSREEIVAFRARPDIRMPDLITDLMSRKLTRRARRYHGDLGPRDLEEIERRARSAHRELREAWRFDYVIPNHDGEDSEHWEALPEPIGEARRAVRAFAALVRGEVPEDAERWEEGLLG